MLKPTQPSNLFANAPTFSYRCLNTIDWPMIYLSSEFECIVETPAEILLSSTESYGKMIHPNEAQTVWNVVQAAIEHQQSFQLTYHIMTPRGHTKLFVEHGHGIYTKSGDLIELQGWITDVSPSAMLNPTEASFDIKVFQQQLTQIAYEKCKMHHINQYNISTREVEIAIYFCQGLTMKEIGLKLNLSNRTVEVYLYRIKSKLNCHSKHELRKILLTTDMGKKCLQIE